MVAEDTKGKLQKKKCKIGKYAAHLSFRERISYKSIFYHLASYLHLVNKVLVNEFDEI